MPDEPTDEGAREQLQRDQEALAERVEQAAQIVEITAQLEVDLLGKIKDKFLTPRFENLRQDYLGRIPLAKATETFFIDLGYPEFCPDLGPIRVNLCYWDATKLEQDVRSGFGMDVLFGIGPSRKYILLPEVDLSLIGNRQGRFEVEERHFATGSMYDPDQLANRAVEVIREGKKPEELNLELGLMDILHRTHGK